MDQTTGSEAAEAGRFYDALRSSGLSSAALAHGAASIGQECLLTVDEIAAIARRAGITAGTSVLDIGSGTGGPACYLARELGCRVLGVDVSTGGHAQAEARARDCGLGHLAQFRLGDIHTIEEGYLAERARFEASRGPERYQQGLERLEMSQRFAATGVLGEFGCIAVKPAS